MPLRSIAVCGLGRVGTVAAKLLHESGFQVVGLDVRGPAGPPSFPCSTVDLASLAGVGAALESCDAVLSCLPYRLNRHLAAAAHALGIHYFDLTEDVSTTMAVKELGAHGARRDGAAVRPGARASSASSARHRSSSSTPAGRCGCGSARCRRTPPA